MTRTTILVSSSEPSRDPASAAPYDREAVGAEETAFAAPAMTRLFELAGDLLATLSPEGVVGLVNPAWEELLGWSPEELRSRPLGRLVHPDDLERTREHLRPEADGGRFTNFAIRLRHKDGSWRWLLWSARYEDGNWYARASDITDRQQLERQALHDPLTKLPNRVLLMDRARQALARLHRGRSPVALLFIDLDRFKAVNDTLGHAAGDELLILVAERLDGVLRDSDTVARLGGDEFVILAEDLDGDAEAIAVAERVLHALEESFQVGAAEISMRASVGVAVAHDASANAEDLLREADMAMYRAKGAGGHDLELFDERLRRQVAERLDVDDRLRHALPRHELYVAYQPQLRLDGRGRVGWEALVRWHPHGALQIEPADFLPLAEESRLILNLGEWMLRAACVQAAAWMRRERIRPTMSVNVSARELADGDIVERVRDALQQSGLPAGALCVEISEDAVLGDLARASEALERLKSLGIHIALDNFGVGSSSLSLPGALPVDTVKLDRALIQGLEHDRHKRAMVSAMVSLARETKLRLVAMGIESERQLKLVRRFGCPVGQGFLLAPPQVPA
jgi:diguanylate cyclase (GGDEF)-like protein/PAS domain S-box-containing protein